MKNFKKRTIALVLASVVTVAGSFASDRYKNSLMGLDFETSESGVMSMVIQTKTHYSGNLTPIKRDANTYVLTLPEIDSKAPTPDLTKNPYVQSVNIRTMPYTNSGSGYTRITIKTINLQALPVQNRLYIAEQSFNPESRRLAIEKERQESLKQERIEQENLREQEEYRRAQERQKLEQVRQKSNETQIKKQVSNETAIKEEKEDTVQTKTLNKKKTNFSTETQGNNESFLLIMGILLVILCSIFFYIKARDKMVELSGESLNVDTKEDEEKKKTQKKEHKNLNKIKNTIKTLDSTYAKSAVIQKKEYTTPVKQEKPKPVEKVNVVDLDKLFQEQVQSKNEQLEENEDENKALEDFLSGFSFDEEYGLENVEESFNDDLFEKIINGKYKFNKEDLNCINNLLSLEIQDNTIKNAKDYLVSSPIAPKSKEKVLEDLITTYTISQNINFTKDDVEALNKLINIEIDSSFITDLRTNPERTKEVYKELSKPKSNYRKPSEIITLKVSEDLPDISEAIKKQGNKKIESNYKPQTVYFSEGYEVSTLSIKDSLPDLEKEINNEKAYMSKPSAKVELVDNSYDVETLSISSDIPDLADVAKNPQKYEKQKNEEEIIVDEKVLLENISKVSFKPFFDGTEEFEILNDLDNFYAEEDNNTNDILSRDEIAAEFEELYSEKIEFNQKEETVENIIENTNKKTAKIEAPEINTSINQKEEKKAINIEKTPRKEHSSLSQEVLQKIQSRRTKTRLDLSKKENNLRKEINRPNIEPPKTICVIENESYNVLSSVVFFKDTGCYLAKNTNGYVVIGYIGDKLFKLKTYEALKSEKIQARMSEKISDNVMRYIVRIGINKFIIDADNKDKTIKYVMELC